jgi:signal transduction histidine kinase
LFLTFEEALNNVLKHSAATKVSVEMTVAAAECSVKITDNGKGFAVPGSPAGVSARGGRGGNGLKNMRQRLADIGGECLIVSRPGDGTTITIRIHLNPKAQKKTRKKASPFPSWMTRRICASISPVT